MNSVSAMPPEYIALAYERSTHACAPHSQPEQFGYSFTDWVSPYTKSASRLGGPVFVLQDWASAEGLRTFNPEIQLYGRNPGLLTNRRFAELLKRVLRLSLADVYVTNAFPFVKNGPMSAALSVRTVREAARRFLRRELELVNHTQVFALGAVAAEALAACGVPHVRLPHPAARGKGLAKQEAEWRAALSATAAQSGHVA